jgi:hypothetical protein
MATKKQKRAAALAKREKFMADVKRSGTEALKRERANRARREREEWQEQHDKKHYTFVKECPICSDIRVDLHRNQKTA